jgi:hypothetical protein
MRRPPRPPARAGGAVAAGRAVAPPQSPPSTSAASTAARPPVPAFPEPLPPPPPVQAAVELLFRFPPLFDKAVKGARKKIEDRAAALGYSFADSVAELRGAVPDWEAERAAVEDAGVVYPECVCFFSF